MGKTGGGKTNIANIQIMRRIHANHSVSILDTKFELRQIFKNHAKIYDKEQAKVAIDDIKEEIERRSILFMEASEQFNHPCPNLKKYNELTGANLPYITLVVEEWLVINKLYDVSILNHLLVIGRSFGVFLMVLAQYTNAKELPKSSSVNFNNIIFLGRADRIAFKILFDSIEPEEYEEAKRHLGKPGKAMALINDNIQLLNIPYIDDDKLAEWM